MATPNDEPNMCQYARTILKGYGNEYSASKDAAFCLCCYLFPTGNRHGDEVFINHGFRNWKKAFENFRDHEGGQNSRHNHARVEFELFKDQRHNLDNVLSQQCKQDEIVYRVRLTAVIDVIQFLLKQGLVFCGHDESISSNSRGNFLEVVTLYCERNDEVNKAFNSKSHGNNQLTSPKIQKEIVNACAAEVRKIIVNKIKDKFFSILIDESRDCSIKEQMAVVLRYVDDVGEVIERFVGRSRFCGAFNMRGELNGLKQKFLAENKCAFYIHCFAHQLQLVIVATSSEYASVLMSPELPWLAGGALTGKPRRRKGVGAGLVETSERSPYCLSTEGTDTKTRGIALGMAEKMENVVFVFIAHLMKYRDDGWEELMNEVTTFCSKNEIYMPNMEDVIPGRVRRTIDDEPQTYLHRFRADIFYQVVDLLLNEMNERFTKVNSELLACVACLDPRDSFQTFYREKLLRLAELYSDDFSGFDLGQLRIQLDSYRRKIISAMKFIKTDLRNKMGDNFLTDALMCYVEKDIFASVEIEAILQRFQAMGPLRCQLPTIGKKVVLYTIELRM
ncbi:uncharacterized protein LOC143600079 [Bidens hawaiensis]|uniref:uncharacterized protein LOC143600079 n=1 Tax=Bidens hawaiensis TaxID=980011 RepID=UPI00404A8609